MLYGRGEPRPFAIIFWLYVYVWLGLAGLLQVIHHEAAWPIAIGSGSYERGQFVILTGLVALEIGHWFPTRATSTQREIVGSRLTVLVIFVLVMVPVWVHLLGGLHSLFSSRQEFTSAAFGKGTNKNLANGGIIEAFATVPTFLALYAVLVTRRYRIWRRSRLVLALLAIATLVLDNPISMPRFWIATIITALVFAIPAVQHRRSSLRWVIAIMIFVCIALFPYAAYFRYSSGFKPPPGVVATLTTKGDYDSFEMISAGVQYTTEEGFLYGHQALGDLLFFVPRAIWPAKAQDTGALIASHFELAYTNLSAPLWIESYIDFGYVGVVFIFFLYGLLMRRADDRFVTGNSPFAQFAIPVLAGYSCILLRGALLQAMARLAVMLVVLWLISKPSRERA